MADVTCAKCEQKVICSHYLSIDSGRAGFMVCCLCAQEIIVSMRPVAANG